MPEKRTVNTNTHDGTKPLTEDEVGRIIEMYQAVNDEGLPRYTLADITVATRRPRGTIYWVLREAGIVPKRIRRTPRGAPSVEELVTENQRLRLELEREQAVNTRLMKLLAAIEESEKPTRGKKKLNVTLTSENKRSEG